MARFSSSRAARGPTLPEGASSRYRTRVYDEETQQQGASAQIFSRVRYLSIQFLFH